MSDPPPRGTAGPPGSEVPADEAICPAVVGGSPHRRCQRAAGHDGLHRWQSTDGAQTFDWG